MPVRYYPSSKIITNLNSETVMLRKQNGDYYNGKYYLTYDGKAFSGPSPQVGPSEPLIIEPEYETAPYLKRSDLTVKQKNTFAAKTGITNRVQGKPEYYYPQPTEAEYKRGYLIRYFTKKENDKGFITEISENEYNSIVNGTANYNIRFYQTVKILWKITGPLNNQRRSQYNTIPGIIDTNKRLTEEANKTFLGIVEFIGGDYTKFARPTP